jgi:hypothetical protein
MDWLKKRNLIFSQEHFLRKEITWQSVEGFSYAVVIEGLYKSRDALSLQNGVVEMY